MNFCKDCKFWDKRKLPYHNDIYRRCNAIKEADEITERKRKAYIRDNMESGYYSFHTQADFGCNLFIKLQ